jgi:hypothetical protein
MKSSRGVLIASIFGAGAVLAGCNTTDGLPLVFYQATTVGITDQR